MLIYQQIDMAHDQASNSNSSITCTCTGNGMNGVGELSHSASGTGGIRKVIFDKQIQTERVNSTDSAYDTQSSLSCFSKSNKEAVSIQALNGRTNSGSDIGKLVEELSKENSSLHSRIKGINVLSTFLSEAREKISSLNMQKNKMEIAVENLQSRLHNLGADSSVDLSEHEIFLPGHDKHFLNDLISENMRLQKALKSRAKDSSAVVKEERQTEKIKKLETHLHQLSEKLREKKRELEEIKSSIKASDVDKDKELTKLREEVSHLTQARDSAEQICESLTDQAEQLREQVQAADQKVSETTTSELQKQAKEKESDEIEQELNKMKHLSSNLKPEEQIRILGQQVDQLEKENTRLTDQLKEVIGMNTRWQRYNDQREAYVLKLSKTSHQQQSKITVLEQRCSELNKEIAEQLKDIGMLKRQEENNRDAALISADQQLAQKDEEIVEFKEEVRQLRNLIQTLGSKPPSDLSDKEEIQMLKHQVNQYAADFKAEREDRERVQGQYQSTLKKLKNKEAYIQEHQRQDSRSPRIAVERLPTYNRQYSPYNRQESCRQELKAHGGNQILDEDLPRNVVADGQRGADMFDGRPEVRGEDDFEGLGAVAGDSADEPLQCPHCFREFNVSDHDKFMQHAMNCFDHC